MIRVIASISGVTLIIFCLRMYGRYKQKELRTDDWVALATAVSRTRIQLAELLLTPGQQILLIPMATIPIYSIN